MRAQRSSLFSVLFLALALAGAATAQDWQGGAAFGVRVTDEHGDAIAGAQVVARVSDVEATGPGPIDTDGGGRAVVSGLREGEWFVEVSHGGYMLYSAYVSLRSGKKPIVGFSSQVNTKTSWDPMTVKFQKATADFSRTLSTTRRAEPKPPKVVREQPTAPPKVVRPEPEPPKVVRPEPEPQIEPETPKTDPPPTPVQPAPMPEPEAEAKMTPEPPPASDPPAATEPPATTTEAESPEPAPPAPAPPAPAIQPPVVTPPPADEPHVETTPAPMAPEPTPEPATPAAEEVSEPQEPPAPAEEPTVMAPVASTASAAVAVRKPAPTPAADVPEPETQQIESPAAPPVTPPQSQPAPEPEPVVPEVIVPEVHEPEAIEPEPSEPIVTSESEPVAEVVAMEQSPQPASTPPAITAPAPTAPVQRAAPPAPTPSVPATPDAETAPSVPGRLPRFLRSAASGSCSECESGEWAIAAEQEAARASDVTSRSECNAAYLERVSDAAQMLADTPSERLDNYAGPVLTAMFRLDGQARDQVQDLLASVTDPESNCQMAGIVIPEGASFSGYVLEAWDSLGGRACRAGLDCAVGRARWLEDPQVVEGAERVVVYNIFKNRSSRRERRLRMTIYFKPLDPAWVPRTR